MLRINVLAESPSPHMMDFWEAIHEDEDVELKLFFERPTSSTKSWGRIAKHLNADVGDWSRLSIADKIRWLKRTASVGADVWVLDDNYWFWEHHLLSFWMRRKNIPTVYLAERIYWESRQSIDTNSWKNTAYRVVKKAAVPFIIRSFDAFACLGTWAAEQYRIITTGKYVFATEYYVDLDDLRQIERPIERPNDSVNLGFCGALTPLKGLRYIVCNLELISRFSNWELKVAGDGPLRNELEAAIIKQLRPKVEFFGHVPAHKMKAFWKSVDVFLFPSLSDGWGMAVVEALAAGVPVISGTNVGAARQYIRNGYNGEIRNVDDSFLQVIVPILEDPRKLDELSANARASVENYRPEIGAENFIKHLRILTNQG